MKTIRTAILALMLAGYGQAWGGYDEGFTAYEAGDYLTALQEWKPLAEHGDVDAQYNLGVIYMNGHGTPMDHKEAVKWFRKAVEQDHAGAQHNLGLMYEYGRGVTEDYKEAVKWYRKAAEQGNADAQNSIGSMYNNGQGVPQSYVQAHKWFNIAGANGSEIGTSNRDAIANKMTPAQIAEAQKLAREWMEKHP